jgi:hypothetical protein
VLGAGLGVLLAFACFFCYHVAKYRRMFMLKTLEGVYRNGKIALVEHPGDIADETCVPVTILPSADSISKRMGSM